jgi:hypothetical protein
MDELQSIQSQHEESNHHRHREIQKKYHLPPTPTRPTTGSTISTTSSRHSHSHSHHPHHQSSSAVPLKTPIKSSGSVESKDSSAPSSENSKEFLQVEKNFKDARDTIRLLTQKLGTSNPKNISVINNSSIILQLVSFLISF